jgi:hypothetical protein
VPPVRLVLIKEDLELAVNAACSESTVLTERVAWHDADGDYLLLEKPDQVDGWVVLVGPGSDVIGLFSAVVEMFAVCQRSFGY